MKPNLIIVDVQPEYYNGRLTGDAELAAGRRVGFDGFFLDALFKFLTASVRQKTYQKIFYLYNGKETLDMISKVDLVMWLLEFGLPEDIINTGEIRFFDKAYAWFAPCLEDSHSHGPDLKETVRLVRYMYQHKIHDSRELQPEMLKKFTGLLGENHLDPMIIPDLMYYLDEHVHGPSHLIGGSSTACLAEVEIALLALKKKFKRLEDLIYY